MIDFRCKAMNNDSFAHFFITFIQMQAPRISSRSRAVSSRSKRRLTGSRHPCWRTSSAHRIPSPRTTRPWSTSSTHPAVGLSACSPPWAPATRACRTLLSMRSTVCAGSIPPRTWCGCRGTRRPLPMPSSGRTDAISPIPRETSKRLSSRRPVSLKQFLQKFPIRRQHQHSFIVAFVNLFSLSLLPHCPAMFGHSSPAP